MRFLVLIAHGRTRRPLTPVLQCSSGAAGLCSFAKGEGVARSTASPQNVLRQHIQIVGGLLVLMWLVAMIDFLIATPLFALSFSMYGIVPRDMTGLRGIVFAPFIHGSWPHLLANSLPFLVLGSLLLLRGRSLFVRVSLGCVVLGGLGTWLIGAPGLHIGASGLIFGYFGFLLLRGVFERSLWSIMQAALVGFLYGGLLWGVLPSQPGVSWEGHLMGFVSGAILARLLRR